MQSQNHQLTSKVRHKSAVSAVIDMCAGCIESPKMLSNVHSAFLRQHPDCDSVNSCLLICQIVIQFQVIILPSIRIEIVLTALLFLLLFKNILKEVGNWTNSGSFFAQNGLLWAWLCTVSSHRRKKVSVLHCGSEIYAIFWHLKLFEKRVFIRYGWVNPNVKKRWKSESLTKHNVQCARLSSCCLCNWSQYDNKFKLNSWVKDEKWRYKGTKKTRYWTEVLYFFHFLFVVLIRDEELDPASRAHLEEGWQWGSSIRFLPSAALEEGRRSLKPTTLHLGGQYVPFFLWLFFSDINVLGSHLLSFMLVSCHPT